MIDARGSAHLESVSGRVLFLSLLLILGMSRPGEGRMKAEEYDRLLGTIESQREELAAELAASEGRARDAVLGKAKRVAERIIIDDLLPAWLGTPWDFYGACERPTEGAIACGHFVAVILAHGGFRVERPRLGMQASEHIIKTMVGEDRIQRHRLKTGSAVAAATRERGDGVYIVGLDFHAGFLVVEGEEVRFCHASFRRPNRVVCEDPATAEAFVSDYRVVGKLMDRRMTSRWLAGEAFPTVGGVAK